MSQEKLTLEHLSAYLPYELKIMLGDGRKMEVIGIRNWIGWCVTYKADYGEVNIGIKAAKPILRPIFDLTKEIEHNGDKFVPMEKITEKFGGRPIKYDGNCFYTPIQKSMVRVKEDVVPLHFSQYDAFQCLFEWHFDVFGLIDKGLAVSIHDVG